MSRLTAAFLWTLLALYVGAAGLGVIAAGAWEIGTALLLFSAFCARTAYVLGKDSP